MPYRSTDWKPARYRGQQLTGIKEHRSDETKFLFDISVKGIRKKRFMTFDGTESQRYQEAIKSYAEFRAEIYQGYFLEPVTFGDMFGRWISLKPDTRWTRLQRGIYRNHIAQFIADTNLQTIRAKDIDRIMTAAKSLKPATRKQIVSLVKRVLTMATDEKIIRSLPMEPRHKVTVNALEQKTVILDAAALYRRVYQSIVEIYANDPKWRAIFLLGLHGRRKSEILSMRWNELSFHTKTYVIPSKNSKIKQDLTFAIPSDVLEALHEIRPKKAKGVIFANPNTGRPYTNIRAEVQRVRDCSGWKEFGFHRMRNLLSSAMFNSGVEAENLSSVLGHTSPETLKQYLTMQRKEACKIVEDAAQKLLSKIN